MSDPANPESGGIAALIVNLIETRDRLTEQACEALIGTGYDLARTCVLHVAPGDGDVTLNVGFFRVYPGQSGPPGSIVYAMSLLQPKARA